MVAISSDYGFLSIDLDKEILPGFLVRDMLENVVQGTLGQVMQKVIFQEDNGTDGDIGPP